jgi:hypothetical protein
VQAQPLPEEKKEGYSDLVKNLSDFQKNEIEKSSEVVAKEAI